MSNKIKIFKYENNDISVSVKILELYKQAYGEDTSDAFIAYLFNISDIQKNDDMNIKQRKMDAMLLQEIKFAKEIPNILERLPDIIKEYDMTGAFESR